MSAVEELVEMFLFNNEEASSVYNRVTKEVIFDELEEINWDDKEMTNDLVIIPQISSKEAYDLMVQFAKQQQNPAAEQLLAMLQEKKPFNKFKSQLHTLNLGDEWYEYENDYARKIMTIWLEENK